jgi:hypothetical protein
MNEDISFVADTQENTDDHKEVVAVVVPCIKPTTIATDSGFRDGGTMT